MMQQPSQQSQLYQPQTRQFANTSAARTLHGPQNLSDTNHYYTTAANAITTTAMSMSRTTMPSSHKS